MQGFWKGPSEPAEKRLTADLDFEQHTILVARSYERETTKGGHADIIPMAEPIVPVLRRAVAQSPSELVFPNEEGKMRKPSSAKLELVLRRALVQAGLIDGWEHVCRRCKARGKPYIERSVDPGERRCPNCKMRLWPRAVPSRRRPCCRSLRIRTQTREKLLPARLRLLH